MLTPFVALAAPVLTQISPPFTDAQPLLPSFEQPGRSAVGDIDGDGAPEIVVAYSLTGEVHAFSAPAPDGSFPRRLVTTLGAVPKAMEFRDLNGDGVLDFLQVSDAGDLSWAPGQGDATFGAPIVLGSIPGSQPGKIDVVDMDGDGQLDIVAASFLSSGRVQICYGNGSASGFDSPQVLVDQFTGIIGFDIGDNDGDGDLDVLLLRSFGGAAVFENRGTLPIPEANGSRLESNGTQLYLRDATFIDADGDGDLDVASSFSISSSLAAYHENLGGQAYGNPVPIGFSGFSSEIKCVDLDSDGDEDMVVYDRSFGPDHLLSFLNDGAGNWTAGPTLAEGRRSLAGWHLLDITGTSAIDAVVVTEYLSIVDDDSRVEIFPGNGVSFDSPVHLSPVFHRVPLLPVQLGGAHGSVLGVDVFGDTAYLMDRTSALELGPPRIAVEIEPFAALPAVGDATGDGVDDLLTTLGGQMVLYPGDSTTAGFGSPVALPPSSNSIDAVELVDLDGDGDLDVLATGQSGTRLVRSLNDGTGAFGSVISVGGAIEDPGGFPVVDDLNGDGLADLFVASGNEVQVGLGLGGGVFQTRQLVGDAVGLVLPPSIVDLNGDGVLDLLVGRRGASGGIAQRRVLWYEGLGGLSFSGAQSVASDLPTSPFKVFPFDADEDGDFDVLAQVSPGFVLVENLGDGTFAAPTLFDEAARISSLMDLDGDGDQDLIASRSDQRVDVLGGTLIVPVGQPICAPSVPNSTGMGGEIAAAGSLDVATNSLSLLATSLPPATFGFFLVSSTQDLVTSVPGSEGTLCLGGAIGRYVAANQIQNSGAAGQFELALDLSAIPCPSGSFIAAQPGDTWFFQAWHRDTAASGGATSNFTTAVELTFE
jgi:hypothetical protein